MEFRRYARDDEFFANNQTGQFNFDTTWTRGPLDNSPAAPNSLGQSFASFLLGLPSSGTVSGPASYDEASTTWGFFVQDDWRVGDRLTLNLGLRYESRRRSSKGQQERARVRRGRRAADRSGGAAPR